MMDDNLYQSIELQVSLLHPFPGQGPPSRDSWPVSSQLHEQCSCSSVFSPKQFGIETGQVSDTPAYLRNARQRTGCIDASSNDPSLYRFSSKYITRSLEETQAEGMYPVARSAWVYISSTERDLPKLDDNTQIVPFIDRCFLILAFTPSKERYSRQQLTKVISQVTCRLHHLLLPCFLRICGVLTGPSFQTQPTHSHQMRNSLIKYLPLRKQKFVSLNQNPKNEPSGVDLNKRSTGPTRRQVGQHRGTKKQEL